MELNDLLIKQGIDPAKVLVLRHRPTERELNRVFPALVSDHHDAFDAYQATQNPTVEKAMAKATHIASFYGHKPGKALFLGLYSRDGQRPITSAEFAEMAAYQKLWEHGHRPTAREDFLYFTLTPTEALAKWQGKMVVSWPGKEVGWHRWAGNNVFPIEAITEQSQLVEEIPHWKQVRLTWAELTMFHKSWERELSRWRGIYYIFDTAQSKGYVGSAGSENNIWQRWSDHLKKGGDAKKLRLCDPRNFVFTILEITNHEMPVDELVAIETNWKLRLNTVQGGLNDN